MNPELIEVSFYPAYDDIVNGCEHKTKGNHGRGGLKIVWRYGNPDLQLGLEWLAPLYLPETVEAIGQRHDPRDYTMGAVDIHRSYEAYEGQIHNAPGYCKWMQADCYFDTGFGIADPLLESLLREGSEAMLAKLNDLWWEIWNEDHT